MWQAIAEGITRTLALLTGRGAEPRRSSKWPAVRKAHLAKFPTCAACGTKEKLEVHHIWPVSWPGGENSELDPSNLITLCEAPGRNCHLNVGHLGDYASRNPAVIVDAAWWRAKREGRPYPRGGR